MKITIINKIEEAVLLVKKIYTTIRLALFHPLQILLELRKAEYKNILPPYIFYILSAVGLIIITQYAPLGKSFAPQYAPWRFTEDDKFSLPVPNQFVFIASTIIPYLVITAIISRLLSISNSKLINGLFLYIGASFIFLKTIFIVCYPLLLKYTTRGGLSSSLYITPTMFYYFDIGPYLLIIALLLFFPSSRTKQNSYYEAFASLTPFPLFKRYSGMFALIFLAGFLSTLNFSADYTTKGIYDSIMNGRKDIYFSLVDKKGNTEVLWLDASEEDTSIILNASLRLHSNMETVLVPVDSSYNFHLYVDELKARNYSISGAFLKIEFSDDTLAKDFIELKAGKYYKVQLKAKMTIRQFKSFCKRFEDKKIEMGFSFYGKVNDSPGNRTIKRIIKINRQWNGITLPELAGSPVFQRPFSSNLVSIPISLPFSNP